MNNDRRWYIIQTYSGFENSVKEDLERRIETMGQQDYIFNVLIPEEEYDRIFERFYRVDKSHSKETGGTGLGLSIVKHAALIHDIKINVESEMGKGTKMEILF